MNGPSTSEPVAVSVSPRQGEVAPPSERSSEKAEGVSLEERIRESLRGVIDPDLGVNIVDLGFIRRISISGRRAELQMTLTNRFCPLNSVFEDQMRTALVGGGLLDDLAVEWVFDPPWTPDEVTGEARRQLREIGFSTM